MWADVGLLGQEAPARLYKVRLGAVYQADSRIVQGRDTLTGAVLGIPHHNYELIADGQGRANRLQGGVVQLHPVVNDRQA